METDVKDKKDYDVKDFIKAKYVHNIRSSSSSSSSSSSRKGDVTPCNCISLAAERAADRVCILVSPVSTIRLLRCGVVAGLPIVVITPLSETFGYAY